MRLHCCVAVLFACRAIYVAAPPPPRSTASVRVAYPTFPAPACAPACTACHVVLLICRAALCCSGLRTALIEREDWAAGTSSRSTKLVHGGVRYLEKVGACCCLHTTLMLQVGYVPLSSHGLCVGKRRRWHGGQGMAPTVTNLLCFAGLQEPGLVAVQAGVRGAARAQRAAQKCALPQQPAAHHDGAMVVPAVWSFLACLGDKR